MISKRSFLIFAVLASVVVGGLAFYYISTQQEIVNVLNGGSKLVIKEKEVSPIPATGNVDDTVNSLMKELDDEAVATEDLEGDLDLIDSDSQEVDDFGQSVNENDF